MPTSCRFDCSSSCFSVRLTELYVGDRKALQDPFVWITSKMVSCTGKNADIVQLIKL